MGIVYATTMNRFPTQVPVDHSRHSCEPCSRRYEPEVPCIPCKLPPTPGNPGTFEEIHKKMTDLNPPIFEGMKLLVRKPLSSHFKVDHTLTLSSVTPSGYKFGTSYTGTKRIGEKEKYPIATGDITSNGNMTANFVHTFGCRFRTKFSAQIANNKYKAARLTTEYRSDNCTLSLSMAEPNFIKQHGTMVFHYLQSITSRIALGCEVACHRGLKVPGGQQSIMSGALRYSTGFLTFSTTLGEAGLHLSCHTKASRQLQIGAEININMRTHESIGTLVFRLDVPHADMVFRGIVNSNTTVGAVFEKKLYPIQESSLVISAMLNHVKQQCRVGIGLNIG
ncbi:mitochondrial import receptor subunit TOM40 homolog 1-like [Athalia rosae]|uniref:mitochondrial import receptor subunit TOM40 homolog 1-like n=1 Tax=Athalia rosae TaxID=37344 RepID=UPI000624F52E|nr:mitochondrial import receptor subunit TOM40 homolog 1-like [Athalia rosae]